MFSELHKTFVLDREKELHRAQFNDGSYFYPHVTCKNHHKCNVTILLMQQSSTRYPAHE